MYIIKVFRVFNNSNKTLTDRINGLTVIIVHVWLPCMSLGFLIVHLVKMCIYSPRIPYAEGVGQLGP